MNEWMNAYVQTHDQYFRSLRQMLRPASQHPPPSHLPPYFTPEETGNLDSKDISTTTWLGCAVGEVTSPLKTKSRNAVFSRLVCDTIYGDQTEAWQTQFTEAWQVTQLPAI